jgi:hypothetical protein
MSKGLLSEYVRPEGYRVMKHTLMTRLLAGCLLAACSDGVGPAAPAPAALAVVAGDAQAGTAGAELTQPLVVRVTAADGSPLADVAVTFTVSAGGGTVAPATQPTDPGGRAEARWTLGTSVAQPQRAEARVAVAGGADLVAAFTATARPGAPDTIHVTALSAELRVGTSLQLAAAVVDAFDNPIPDAAVAWTVEPAGVASVTSTGLATGLAPGTATFTATAGSALGTLPLEVVSRPLAPADITFTLGKPQIVYDYSTERCNVMDLPDVTVRAVRMADGTIALYSGNAPRAYASFGPDFDSLVRSCVPTLVSADDSTAPSFTNQEWLSTVYREGGVYHAIVHNEFHDPVHPNCRQGDTSPANPCWYNGLTYASSTDGRVFTPPPSPDHVLAGPPQTWDPEAGPRGGAPGPYGYFAPSNIVRRPDGFYYAMFFTIPDKSNPPLRGSCVMRTHDLSDPASWRAWDGAGYNLAMPSPYTAAATGTACTIVLPGGIDGSLTFNTYLGRYLYVGGSGAIIDGVLTCGFLFSISEDLITWSAPRVLKHAPVPFPPCGSGTNIGREHYPSLIDHADTSVNFEYTGQTPHVYYMRYNDQALDRDLVRVPVIIQVSGGGADR